MVVKGDSKVDNNSFGGPLLKKTRDPTILEQYVGTRIFDD